MKTEILEMSLLEHNTGQVPKVPANPRLIDEGMFELLKDSIKRSPVSTCSNYVLHCSTLRSFMH